MRPLHILVIPSFYSDPHVPLSGVFFKEQATALADCGLNVGVAYYEARSLRSFCWSSIEESHFHTTTLNEDGVATVRRHGWNPLITTWIGSRVWVFLTQQLAERYIARFGRPDVLHAQCALWGGSSARRLAQKSGIPYVVTEHSTLLVNPARAVAFRRDLSRVYRDAAGISAVTRYLAEQMKGFTAGRRIAITPNLLPPQFAVAPNETPSRSGFSFLAIGRLVPHKAFHILLEAFAMACAKRIDLRLRIGGKGPEAPRLRAMAVRLGLAAKVEFLGELTRFQVRNAMIEADAFVVPSLFETFGVVAIEAMACGLPVIATRGGPSELVSPDVGILVNPGDAVELSRALTAVSSAVTFDRRHIRQYSLDNFGSEAFCRRLIAFYGESVPGLNLG